MHDSPSDGQNCGVSFYHDAENRNLLIHLATVPNAKEFADWVAKVHQQSFASELCGFITNLSGTTVLHCIRIPDPPASTDVYSPLSSPLWSLPSPSQTLVSLHPNQTPPLRNFLGHNTSRISQSPLCGPWIASSTPAHDNNSYLSASPVTDTFKSSSIKGTSAPSSSSIKNVPPNLQASNVGLQNVFLQTTPLFNTNNVTVSSARHSCDPKSKKRKKVTTESEDLGHKAIHMQSHLVSTPVVSNHISPANATATPVVNVPVTTVEKSVESVSPLSLPDRLKSGWNVEKRIMSDESLTKIEEARINTEEASALSAAAVNHSMGYRNRKTNKKKMVEHLSYVNSCCPSRRGPPLVASGSDDGTAKLWDMRQRGSIQTFPDKYQITAVSFCDASDKIYTGGIDNDVKIWDLRKGEVIMTLQGH
ncbi:hypothetical protein KIW84_066068 [Lathyrus oleraceus]|uniref:Uncharacterized protein n=1 Tax=Pisum sativum TaxID=3888 RepID=A0A9D4WEN7_PEA|nr:hypothetical protein KIW84_066068 [Pisum sativum]